MATGLDMLNTTLKLTQPRVERGDLSSHGLNGLPGRGQFAVEPLNRLRRRHAAFTLTGTSRVRESPGSTLEWV